MAPKGAVLSDPQSSTNDESKARVTCVQCRTLGKQEFSLRSAMQGGSCFWYLRAMPNARQTGIFPAECNAGWELFLVPVCNAERSANRNFPCGVQCRVGAVLGTCVQCRTLGKQEFSLRSAMQGGSCGLPLLREPACFLPYSSSLKFK